MVLAFLFGLSSLSQAFDNSVDKDVEVSGGSTIGAPLPPTCTGDKALQWDGGNWQCNSIAATAGAAKMKYTVSENMYPSGSTWIQNFDVTFRPGRSGSAGNWLP